MKIVITGALGHIGSRLIRDLPRVFPRATIIMIDNLVTQRYCSLFYLPRMGRYRFIEADIMHADLPKLFSGATTVIHLAALTDAAHSFGNVEEIERVNFKGTRAVASACVKVLCPLIYISTTSVYAPRRAVVDEDCPASEIVPQTPYAASKLKGERLLARLGRQEGLRFVTCRFGTIFGTSPGMRFHTAVNKFCWQAVMGQKLTVWKSAYTQRRPYLDLGDAVRALQFFLQRKLFDGRVYNVVTTNTDVKDIVNCIRLRIPTVEVQLVESPAMNQLSYDVGTARLRNRGFRFRGNLQRGIGRTISLLRAACERA